MGPSSLVVNGKFYLRNWISAYSVFMEEFMKHFKELHPEIKFDVVIGIW